MEEKQLSEQESLKLITEMIHKAKGSVHESGTSAILWGSVIAVCGLTTFAQEHWKFSLGFDIWLLTLAAIVPQVFLSIRESRQRKALTYTESALNVVWIVYTISIFALVFYNNVVPGVSDRWDAHDHRVIMQYIDENEGTVFHHYIPSVFSLFLLLYAIPTLTTGLVARFRPMIIGATLCYIFFIISCFTAFEYDALLNGLAGIFNWLIPGLILRTRFLRRKKEIHV